MYAQLLTIRRVRVAAVLAVCVAVPISAYAVPPSSNPGQPFAEILAQMGILNDKLDELLANGDGVDLRGVTQNWDKKLPADDGPPCDSSRFTCIFPDATHPDGAAVRDNETGIVWERSPDTGNKNWYQAIQHCVLKEVGGRKGWSLPMFEQLQSLVVEANQPTLPTGHPFLNIQSNFFYSATSLPNDPTEARGVHFTEGPGSASKEGTGLSGGWCARGGQVYDGQDLNSLPTPE